MSTATLDGPTTAPGASAVLSDYELERGKPPPTFNHGMIQANLSGALGSSRDYLRLGDKSCWLVDPPMRQITVFTAAGKKKAWEEGLVTDPVTGLTADVEAVFS